MSSTGWTRLIVEKPFGHDLESANQLVKDMNAIFTEADNNTNNPNPRSLTLTT